jgi:hypothetical protein
VGGFEVLYFVSSADEPNKRGGKHDIDVALIDLVHYFRNTVMYFYMYNI